MIEYIYYYEYIITLYYIIYYAFQCWLLKYDVFPMIYNLIRNSKY